MSWLNKINVSRIIDKILILYRRYFQTTLYLYYIKGSNYEWKEVYPIYVATTILQLSNVCCDDAFRRLAERRFHYGQHLIFSCDNATIIGYGWRIPITKAIYSQEIANDILFPKPIDVLYDFYVNPNYRKRGLYKSLLHFIINNSTENTRLVIYVESTNNPSIKAINSCGFRFVSKVTHFSNKVKKSRGMLDF